MSNEHKLSRFFHIQSKSPHIRWGDDGWSFLSLKNQTENINIVKKLYRKQETRAQKIITDLIKKPNGRRKQAKKHRRKPFAKHFTTNYPNIFSTNSCNLCVCTSIWKSSLNKLSVYRVQSLSGLDNHTRPELTVWTSESLVPIVIWDKTSVSRRVTDRLRIAVIRTRGLATWITNQHSLIYSI